ncbi:Type IV pilus assembly ATPase TfpB [Candidatus Magnetomoraceae bacterium gMMP-13]
MPAIIEKKILGMTDNEILKIFVKNNILSEKQSKSILKKAAEIKQNLIQIHSLNINGKKTNIEHPATIIDIIASMNIPLINSAGGILDEEEIIKELCNITQFKYKRIDPLNLNLEIDTKTIPHLFALKYLVIPISVLNGCLEVVMYDPADVDIIEDIKRVSNMNVIPVMGTKSDILKTLNEFFGFKTSITAAQTKLAKPLVELGNLEQYTRIHSLTELRSDDAHIKNAVDYLFNYAFDQRASDIHIEPKRVETFIRMRIDGVLHTIHKLPKPLHSAIISRIKTLSRLDIAEKRRPQDGRIKIAHKNTDTEIRVSTIPVAFGEKIVMRLLDPNVIFQDTKSLGFSLADLTTYRIFLKKTHGIILITGPTGSGKSTTLYSSLGYLASSEINITTIEDPIEMVHEDFNQIAVQPAVDITFSSILRNILRQDPDIIMIGEMRDHETAENGIQAALTGHLVFSTLHTNDAPSSITRLIDLGIKPFLIAESLVGVVAQRLVRKICPYCTAKVKVDDAALESLGVNIKKIRNKYGSSFSLKQGKGCAKCRGTGYLGRIGIFEVMGINKNIKKIITKQDDLDILDLRRKALDSGMISLRRNAIDKMLKGVTTLQEVVRITEN